MKTIIASTDTELVQAFQNGSNEAIEVLINRHKDKIYTSIAVLLKDKYLAEDIFQEVFIKIIDTLRAKRYNDEGKFLPWALRIAHNMCIDHIRKVKRRPTITINEDVDIFEVLNFAGEGADSSLLRNEKHQGIRNIIDMLPLEQKEVIVLRHYGDLSFKEIAEMTNTTINTALGRMRYGLINMRKIIAKQQVAI